MNRYHELDSIYAEVEKRLREETTVSDVLMGHAEITGRVDIRLVDEYGDELAYGPLTDIPRKIFVQASIPRVVVHPIYDKWINMPFSD